MTQTLSRGRSPGITQVAREVLKSWQSYLFLSPLLIFFLLLQIGALVASFGISLTRWAPGGTPEWRGLGNYARLLQDEVFWIALRNTFGYAFMVIAIGIPLALILALMLDAGIPFRGIFLVAFYLPAVTSSVVVVIVWRWLLHPSYGIVNVLLQSAGLPAQNFLSDPNLALPTVAAMAIWGGVGYNVVIFLAGLQGIPNDLHDAARVDGANTWQRFWRITLPLLRPTMLFVLILSTVGAFQVFETVQLLPTPGGPLRATTTATFFIWEQAFRYVGRMGYASAAAFVLGMIIIGFALLQQRLVRAEEIY